MPATKFNHGVIKGAAIKTANYTVTSEDSGKTIIADAADLVITLPATIAGFELRVALGPNGLSGGTGLSISPAAADKMMGDGFTPADDKDAILTGATDRIGDAIDIVGDGVDGWLITNVTGTWAREA